MGSVELSMLPEASAGRAAAQFIVRSKGIGGLPPTSNFPVFAQAENREMGIVGTTMHCLPILSLIVDNRFSPAPISRVDKLPFLRIVSAKNHYAFLVFVLLSNMAVMVALIIFKPC